MSFWSSLGKLAGAVGSVAGPVVSLANPLLGAGITVGSSALGKMSTDYENKKAVLNANSVNLAENQKNRDFNSQEALKQRQFEAEQARLANEFSANQAQLAFQRESGFAQKMWKLENDYNSPNAQLQRLRDAGLNPNLFGGDNTAGSVGSASSSAPNGAMPHGTSASVGSSLSVSPYTLTNPALEAAQVRIANANATKAESDAERTKKLLPGEVQIQGKTFDLIGTQISLNKEQENFIRKSAEKQDAEINQINATISKIELETSLFDKQGQLIQKEIDSFEKRLESALNEAASRAKLNLANASEVASKIALNYANAQKAKAEAQSYVLNNYLDDCRLAIYKGSSAWTYSILQSGIMLEAEERARSARHREAEYEPDYKMYQYMNNDVVAFLRALGSVLDLRLTTAVKP